MKTKKKELKAIPFCITLELTFLDDGCDEDGEVMDKETWRAAAKKVIRQCLKLPPEELNEPGIFEVYDEEIQIMIEEVLAEN